MTTLVSRSLRAILGATLLWLSLFAHVALQIRDDILRGRLTADAGGLELHSELLTTLLAEFVAGVLVFSVVEALANRRSFRARVVSYFIAFPLFAGWGGVLMMLAASGACPVWRCATNIGDYPMALLEFAVGNTIFAVPLVFAIRLINRRPNEEALSKSLTDV